MNEITDAEIESIRQRTGGAVADQINRILHLGPYAAGKAEVQSVRIGVIDSRPVKITRQQINWNVIASREL